MAAAGYRHRAARYMLRRRRAEPGRRAGLYIFGCAMATGRRRPAAHAVGDIVLPGSLSARRRDLRRTRPRRSAGAVEATERSAQLASLREPGAVPSPAAPR